MSKAQERTGASLRYEAAMLMAQPTKESESLLIRTECIKRKACSVTAVMCIYPSGSGIHPLCQPTLDYPTLDIPISDNPTSEYPMLLNKDALSRDLLITDFSS